MLGTRVPFTEYPRQWLGVESVGLLDAADLGEAW